MKRVTLRVPQRKVDEVDRLVDAGEFPNRSEAIRTAIRDLVDEHDEPGHEMWSKTATGDD